MTAPEVSDAPDAVSRFLDRLQRIHPLLPLRTVPLEIKAFTPLRNRAAAFMQEALENQHRVLDVWRREIQQRFPATVLTTKIVDVSLVGVSDR